MDMTGVEKLKEKDLRKMAEGLQHTAVDNVTFSEDENVVIWDEADLIAASNQALTGNLESFEEHRLKRDMRNSQYCYVIQAK